MDSETRRSTFSGFLQYLTTFPDPDSVATASVRGPLAQFGCRTFAIWVILNPEELNCVGTHGLENYGFDRYYRVPISFSAPLTDSFLASTTVILPVSDVVVKYPSLRIDLDFWDKVQSDFGDGDVGQVPIFVDGTPIGAFAFICDRVHQWDPRSIALLDGLAAGLGLWLSHPRSKIFDSPRLGNHNGLALTPRQIDILKMVEEGKSNLAIAHSLGFSQSTVKQELQRIMKRLKATSRDEAVSLAREMNLVPENH